jgi:adenosylmethionine-8-amino-7-oxononanoate aminotransferase
MPRTLEQLDRDHVWHPFTQHADWNTHDPMIIVAAEGNSLIARDGRRYLDGVSSLWVNVHGHRCTPIDEAIRQQLDRVAHSTLLGLANPPSIELAARLATIAPRGLNRVFYSDSGSTAVEIALKIAFQYWRNRGRPKKARFVALEHSYHGDTLGSVSVGGIDLFHQIFHPLLFHTERVPAPNPYRAPDATPAACAARCAAALGDLLSQASDTIAALVIEPRVQGAAGIVVHPPGYLAEVARLCRQHDVLLICDEVATGFGRTGHLFSCDAEQVRPDLLALAKGLSGGYLPLAATLATDEIYDAFIGPRQRTFFHGHSFTGNPLACAAALASLDLFEQNAVLSAVRARTKTLADLFERHLLPLEIVGDIRQCGLMAGIELVSDRQNKTPFDPELRIAGRVCQAVRKHGVILRNLGDVVVLMPPLSITDAELATIVTALSSAITEAQRDPDNLPRLGNPS